MGWTPDGRKIYYLFEGQVMEVGITLEPGFRSDTPRALFDLQHHDVGWFWPNLQLSPDGERFVMITPDETWGIATEIKIVLNCFDGREELFSNGD